jgi:hypothetical protein
MGAWMKTRILPFLAGVAGAGVCALSCPSEATAAAFTYQGRLLSGGAPAAGAYDLQATLWDAASGGGRVAGPITNTAVAVSNGLFTTALEFGAVFDGSPRWLELGVRPVGGGAAFTLLTPRQALTPSPYALYAPNAGSVAAAGVTGTLMLTQLPGGVLTNGQGNVALNGAFSGNGAGLTNLTVTAANLVLPVTRSNVLLAGATGALAYLNGSFAWSGTAYTNGASGTNAACIFRDDCWEITNAAGTFLIDTCGSLTWTSVVQTNGGWEDSASSRPLPITTTWQGTTTIPVALFSGSESNLTLGALLQMRYLGDGSQLTGTNHMAITGGVTADALDLSTWTALLKSSFSSYSNWNRFGWQQVSEKIARHQPVTILFHGLGLMSPPSTLVRGLFPRLLQRLPFRGYLNANQGGFLTLDGGAAALPGKDTNWFTSYFALTGPGSTLTWSPGLANFSADTFTLAYLARPGGGMFLVQTNSGSNAWGTVATINATNAALVGRVFAWTNPSPAQVQVRVAGTDATTNYIIDLAMLNSTVTNGLVAGYAINFSASIQQMQQPGPAVTGPILQAWNPDLIFFQAISGPDDTTNFPSLAALYQTYAPNAAVVVCSTYPVKPDSDPTVVQQNALLLQYCQGYGYSFFDGHTPFVDYDHMVARGLISYDGIHGTGLGWDTYNDLLLEWLSLFDAPGANGVIAIRMINRGLEKENARLRDDLQNHEQRLLQLQQAVERLQKGREHQRAETRGVEN